MNFKMLRVALASVILSVSSFANAGLMFSDVSYDSSSVTFTVEGDLTGYATPAQNYGFGIDYLGDIWSGISPNSVNAWSESIFDDISIDDAGRTGVWAGYNDDELYTWSWYSSTLTDATVSNKTITLTLGDNYLNTAALSPQFNIIWGHADQVHSILYTFNGAQSEQIPEPSTLAIFALAIMGLASRKFKK